MKAVGFYLGIAVAAILCVWVLMVSVRWFNNTATSISIQEPAPGVQCALATSQDGVAIDCWQLENP